MRLFNIIINRKSKIAHTVAVLRKMEADGGITLWQKCHMYSLIGIYNSSVFGFCIYPVMHKWNDLRPENKTHAQP